MQTTIHDTCRSAADVVAAARRAQAFRRSIGKSARDLAAAKEADLEREVLARIAKEEAKACAAECEAKRLELAEAKRLELAEAQRAEEERRAKKPLTLKALVEFSASHFGIPLTDLCSERRFMCLVRARQCIFWAARELTDRSLTAIGRAVGGRDHTTVLHGDRRVAAAIADNQQFGADALALRDALRKRFVITKEQGEQ